MTLLDVTWRVDPAIFSIGSWEFRWYAMMFLIGFAIGYKIVERMFKRENLNLKWLDPLLYYTVFGTVIGARLGHCLFYNPSYYLSNPVEILKVWEGGLASHGGVLGIIFAIYFYSKKISHRSMMFTFDKLVTPTGLVAALIRIGNLMNSEIFGRPTDLPWGFRFVKSTDYRKYVPNFDMGCHPTQIYEAICYLLTFALCMWLYFKKDAWKKEGFIFGIFLICIFTSRFFIEFLKYVQENWEKNLVDACGLNMGQLLSIPFVLAGFYFMMKAINNHPDPIKK
jgi:prolipoprotein diacylglyceryl transferase